MRTVSLLDAADLVANRVEPWAGERQYVATGSASDDGLLSPVTITYRDRPSRADIVARSGDVAFARMAATEKVFLVDETSSDYVYSTGFAFLRPRPGVSDPAYLKSLLRSPLLQAAMDANSSGATQRAITNAGISKLTVPLPSLEEQRRIATILDAADAIRTKRRRVLAHLDAVAEAAFADAFGRDEARTTVGDIASAMRTGPFGSDLLHSEFVDEGIAVLGLDNVVGNEFGWSERRFITPKKYEALRRYTVLPGDVLVSIMGTTGRCVVVPDDIPVAINTKHICATTVDRTVIEPSFLRACFLWHPASRAHLLRHTKGAIMDGLNLGIIKSMPLPLPPLGDQRRFAEQVAAVERMKAKTRSALAADSQVFSSLQSRAFSGELT